MVAITRKHYPSTEFRAGHETPSVAQITIGLMVGAASKTQLPLVPVLLHRNPRATGTLLHTGNKAHHAAD